MNNASVVAPSGFYSKNNQDIVQHDDCNDLSSPIWFCNTEFELYSMKLILFRALYTVIVLQGLFIAIFFFIRHNALFTKVMCKDEDFKDDAFRVAGAHCDR